LNVSTELSDWNLFDSDAAMVEGLAREGAAQAQALVRAHGQRLGQAQVLEWGHLANRYPPELDTHDRFGRRLDAVRYHPAYHELMRLALDTGLHSQPWLQPGPGAHVARAAMVSMQAQVEAGHGCPVTMTFASVPTLQIQPEVAELFLDKVLARGYQPDNLPYTQKQALTVGMGMTEKQGGSDVRANTTTAQPLGAAGPGQLYSMTGHKWFLSAPMCDLFLVLAQAPGGLSCFALPRWLPDGSKNALQVIRLKDKMGNRSNASSEVEFRGAQAWLVGEEGRGVPAIIEMVGLTRFDCMLGSAGQMRMGVAQAIHHCQQRSAFGAVLAQQPLMQNVLADLALEYEAALAMSLRLGRALDGRQAGNESEAQLFRLATAVGKYWVCKRGPQHAYEIMECIGGSGVMENSIFPRLFRESVINPIWEGSGNVQCLDVLRAIAKDPQVLEVFRQELHTAQGAHPSLDAHLQSLDRSWAGLPQADSTALQWQARGLVEDMALGLQAALLQQSAPQAIADAFCVSRLGDGRRMHYGALPQGPAVALLLQRHNPAP
jgi:putative acyl-CoA dehydrogenase